MTEAFHAIWDVHEQKKVPLRTAAFIKALQRVTRVRTAALPCSPSACTKRIPVAWTDFTNTPRLSADLTMFLTTQAHIHRGFD
jgi:hypothetical protein